jgi:hypothetical protein
MYDKKLGGDYMEHFQPSPVYQVEISALSVIQNSIKIKRVIVSTQGCVQPRD